MQSGHHWDAQRADFILAFGNEYATQRLRLKLASRFEIAHQCVEVLIGDFIDWGLEHLNADLVNPSRAPIAFDVLERFTHKFRGDSASQRMNFLF